MTDFLTALALVVAIEGLSYAAAPSAMKSLAAKAAELPEQTLRQMGLVALALGVFLVWLIRG
ncbi:DUF2065 domain-containing protein [Aerophototrophica crusticola]|uniref:DUF2065 domain-containing protein n=1 Tax=Aerophototrophica crusticola TaxID=1709002 RepID=A0A858R8M5_9PROT|nr:DUF2065 domain-containing protein [Rhodospirillaceae bacterium B3]